MSRKIILGACGFAAFVFLASTSFAGELTKTPIEPGEVKDANSTRYYAELAAIHQRYKVYDKAEECLKKAIETEQNIAVAADCGYQLGKLYLEWGKGKEAEMMFEFCIEQTPDTGSALITRSRELAQVYESNGQLEKAEAIHRRPFRPAPGPWSGFGKGISRCSPSTHHRAQGWTRSSPSSRTTAALTAAWISIVQTSSSSRWK